MGYKRIAGVCLCFFCLFALAGCGGGQEIESCLFVLALAVDPAPDGNMTVTIKALSGTQEAPSSSGGSRASDGTGDEAEAPRDGRESRLEETEPGYIVMSATAASCLRALSLLSATTPRMVNLSQLREVVISETLARTDAALSILREIYAMYRANAEAVVVVTPDDAGDFIRRQRAILGVRLSKYLEVLFDHYAQMDIIPPRAQLAYVIEAMESGMMDAAAVYAAGNRFDSELVLSGMPDMDRLPGHLPRTSPSENEYLGSALFSGPKMTGTLTGEETGILCLMSGGAQRRTAFIGNAQYKTNTHTRVKRRILPDGTLGVSIRMSLTRIAGGEDMPAGEIGRQIETQCVNVLRKLQAASCDAVGFGALAVRKYPDLPSWARSQWKLKYESMPVQAAADVKVL